MGTSFNAFDWPHSVLLGGAVLGGILVGVGILKESEKWSVAAMLVLVGVIVEPIFTIGLFLYDENVSRYQQSQIIAATDRAAGAELAAAAANKDAAIANEKNATLEKEAARLRLNLAQLTQEAGQRKITPDQFETLRTALSGSGLKIIVFVLYGDDKECVTYGQSIAHALSAIGVFGGVAPISINFSGEGPFFGVATSSSDTLAGAFKAAQIPTVPPSRSFPTGPPQIFVGLKPVQ
jgi:hypothetical protein